MQSNTIMNKDRLKHKIDRMRKRRVAYVINASSLTLNGRSEMAFIEGLIYAYEEMYLDLLDYIEQRDGVDLTELKKELDTYERPISIKHEESDCIGNIGVTLNHCTLYEDPINCAFLDMIEQSYDDDGCTSYFYRCEKTDKVCPRMEFRHKKEWEKITK